MNLELKVNAPKPQPVVINYDELKAGLTTALADYKDKVYDETMLAEAKADTANLNKLKKALNDERIFRKKEFEAPFKVFEDQVKELCGMIDEATSGIKAQLDTYEQKRIDEKKIAIREMFSEIAAEYDSLDFITLDKIYNAKWENKTTTDKAIASEITEHFEKALKDLEVIAQMPNFSFEAKEVYKRTLDLNQAIAEGKRMSDIAEAKKQAEIEAQRRAEEARLRAEEEARRKADEEKAASFGLTPKAAEPTPEPVTEPTYEVAFKCRVTKNQAIALKNFCTANGIALEQIENNKKE